MKYYRKYPTSINAAVDISLRDLNPLDIDRILDSTSPNNVRALKRYAESYNYYMISKLMGDDYDTPEEIREYIKQLYGDCFATFGALIISKISECTSEQLVRWTKTTGVDPAFDEIYAQPQLPVSCLYEGAKTNNVSIWMGICNNPNAPKDLVISLLYKLANHPYDYNREFAAEHEDIPQELLLTLSIDSATNVRRAAFDNPNFPH